MGDLLMVSAVGTRHVTVLMQAKGLMEQGVSVTVAIPEDERCLVEKKVESKYLEAGGLMNFALVTSLSRLEVIDTWLAGMSYYEHGARLRATSPKFAGRAGIWRCTGAQVHCRRSVFGVGAGHVDLLLNHLGSVIKILPIRIGI